MSLQDRFRGEPESLSRWSWVDVKPRVVRRDIVPRASCERYATTATKDALQTRLSLTVVNPAAFHDLYSTAVDQGVMYA